MLLSDMAEACWNKLTLVSGLEDAGERQGAVLADEAADVRAVGSDVGVAGLAELLTEGRLDRQADLLTPVPWADVVSPKLRPKRLGLSVCSGDQLTIALVIAVAVHQGHLDSVVQELTECLDVVAEDEVTSRHERWERVSKNPNLNFSAT